MTTSRLCTVGFEPWPGYGSYARCTKVVTPAALTCIENEILTKLLSIPFHAIRGRRCKILAKFLHLSAALIDLDADGTLV